MTGLLAKDEVWRWMVYKSSPCLSSELSIGMFVGSPSRMVRITGPTSLKPDPVELFTSSASRFYGGAPPWTLE